MKALIILVVLILIATISLFVMSGHTSLSINPAVKTVGISTPVTVQAVNPHGERRVTAYLEQNGQQFPLLDQASPSTRIFWHRHEAARTFTFEAGKSKAANLKEGKAKLVVEAVSNDLRGSTDSVSSDVDVILEPPRVVADVEQHYINQGGMELVTFTASGSYNESGVRVGKYTYRSFPLPGRPAGERLAMFAYPWDLPPDVVPVVYARNGAGTEATAHFSFKLFPKKFRVRDFDLTDALMDKLVNSVDPTNQVAPGKDMLGRFLFINSELRKQNNQTLADLRLKTEEKILWNGPFIHWGKEEADFADVRNYIYHGKKVDQQVHLGFDLSDVANGPVSAGNDGRIVWAAPLGIYGNCVVVDHGYGLQSIYGHMREIDVKVGDMVKKGQKMGIAGSTGLAGGIHVHFSMQIDGVQVNPREWWDPHWIHDRVMVKLDPAQASARTETAEASPAPHHKSGKKRRR